MGTLDRDGNQTNSLAEMKERAVSYFTCLYSTSAGTPPILNLNITFEEHPNEVENAKLKSYPSGEEVWNIVKNLPRAKAPESTS